MNLKQYAKSYDWNGVIFWLMPYRQLQTDVAIGELESIDPQLVYTNRKTNQRVYEKPDSLKRAEDKAAAMHVVLKSDWEVRNLWNITHRTFIFCESLTVDIQFPEGDLSIELSALRDYWHTRSSDVIERWQAFKAIIGVDVCNAWWSAYHATRDNPMPAAAELEQATPPEDPLVLNAGSESTTDTSDSLRVS